MGQVQITGATGLKACLPGEALSSPRAGSLPTSVKGLLSILTKKEKLFETSKTLTIITIHFLPATQNGPKRKPVGNGHTELCHER